MCESAVRYGNGSEDSRVSEKTGAQTVSLCHMHARLGAGWLVKKKKRMVFSPDDDKRSNQR